jgi:hypothetical protein
VDILLSVTLFVLHFSGAKRQSVLFTLIETASVHCHPCDVSVELESETTESFCFFSFSDHSISPRSLVCRAADSLACSRRPALVHRASYIQRRLTLALASPLPIALLSHTIDVVSSLPPFCLHCFNELLPAHFHVFVLCHHSVAMHYLICSHGSLPVRVSFSRTHQCCTRR